VQHHSREWHEAADKIIGGGVLAQIRDGGRDIAESFVTGCIVGTLVNSKVGPVIGGMAAVVRPLVKMFTNIYESAAGKHVRASLRNHFLSIGTR
jgi:hypothetical protein